MDFLLNQKRDNKPYRLRCRFRINAAPAPGYLQSEKVRVAERFVADMHTQGWDYVPRLGFKMTGPYPVITPTTIHIERQPSARQMIDMVRAGSRFIPSKTATQATTLPDLATADAWEYELAAVFIREEILTERADAHEEYYR